VEHVIWRKNRQRFIEQRTLCLDAIAMTTGIHHGWRLVTRRSRAGADRCQRGRCGARGEKQSSPGYKCNALRWMRLTD